MTAAEARKNATDKHLNAKDSQYNTIIGMIRDAANKGEYEVWVYNTSILQPVREKLTTDGFLVGPTQSDRNETLTKISW
jgi:hypothetical protein